MSLLRRICVLILLCAPLVTTTGRAQDAERVADGVRGRYAGLDAMSAGFVQILNSDFMDAPERFSGTLVLRDDKYRIETGSQTIVTDGATTWVFNRDENQVLLNDYVEDETTFSLTVFLRQFDRDYEYEWAGTETVEGALHDLLDLTSRDELATFQHVRLWVRRSDRVITRLNVVDLNEVEMLFRLTDIRFDPVITSDTFRFDPPDGVEIIDLRN